MKFIGKSREFMGYAYYCSPKKFFIICPKNKVHWEIAR